MADLILAGGKALPPGGVLRRGLLLRTLAAVFSVIVVAIGHGAVVTDIACLGLI